MPENLGAIIGIVITVAVFALYTVLILRRKYSRIKSVRATVVNKQTAGQFSKYSKTGKRQNYYVTFQINGKRKSFSVSEFSYKGYRIGESGTLEYKGDRLIDFH